MFIEPDGSWPIVWERAKGVHVWDAEGKKYLDLTAAFGVAAAGHANPNVVKAGQKQMAKLLHAMGDVHPHALKAELARELSRITFERWAKQNRQTKSKSATAKPFSAIPALKPSNPRSKPRCSPPANAASSRLKARITVLATARSTPRIANIFRSPFRSQLREFGHFASVPNDKPADLADRSKYQHPPDFPPRKDRRDSRRTDSGARRHQCSAAGISAAAPQTLRRTRRAADPRRDLHRLWPHRKMVRLRTFRRDSRFDLSRQGAHRRLSAFRLRRPRRFDGRRVARLDRRGDPHQHVSRPSRRLRDGAGANRGNPTAQTVRTQREARANFCSKNLPSIRHPQLQSSILSRGLGLMVGVELNLPDGKPATEAALNAIKTLLHRGYHFPARRRTRQRHQLHAAADHHQGATGQSRRRT